MSYKISVVSTDFDLKDLRSQVIDFLERTGFKVSAFERSGFRVEPGRHSHDVCLDNIHEADIVVVVVDKRYGGTYRGCRHQTSSAISITELEWQEASRLKKIIIPCIRDAAYDKAHSCELLFRTTGIKSTLEYFECYDVVDFIHKLRTADIDNYSIFFDDATDLTNKLAGRLRGLSPYFLRKLARSMVEIVGNQRTAFPTDFSLRELWENELHVPSNYRRRGDGERLCEDLNPQLLRIAKQRQSTLLLAPPGMGKTTALYAAFRSAVEDSDPYGTWIPLFVFLPDIPSGATLEQTIAHLEEMYGENGCYPLLDLGHVRSYFFVDGLDEALQPENLSISALSISVLQAPHVVACRTFEFDTYIASNSVTSTYHSIWELLPWRRDTEMERYINALPDPVIADRLRKALDDPNIRQLLSIPLLFRMAAYVISEGAEQAPPTRAQLYARFFSLWLARESGRQGSYKNLARDCLASWAQVAWNIYISDRDWLSEDETKSVLAESSLIADDSRFWIVFDRGLRRRFIHPSYGEFLTAMHVLANIKNALPTHTMLDVHLTREIRHFLVELIDADPSRTAIVESLATILKSTPSTGTRHINNQAFYLLGHLMDRASLATLESMRSVQLHPFDKSSLYWALIRRGVPDAEKEYLVRLIESESDPTGLDALNRGYHLFYYGEWFHDSSPPFYDHGTCTWERTRASLDNQLRSSSASTQTHYLLNLYTLLRFLETRNERVSAVSASWIGPKATDERRLAGGDRELLEARIRNRFNQLIER